MKNSGKKTISVNKSAFHEYFVIEKYTAGVVLTGTEIKSVRKGAINLKDAFARVENAEMFLYNCHISPYEQGNRYNHEEKRIRKLLLNKKEILKIFGKVKQDNYAIIPLELFLFNGLAKIEIALCKGKKLYDKRESIKNRDISRDLKKIK